MQLKKTQIIVLIYIYLFIGIILLHYFKLHSSYIVIILFISFKWLFNYRKCTFSRLECILRGVKKENGILYNFLESIVDIRYNNHVYIYSILVVYILYIYYIKQKNKINFL